MLDWVEGALARRPRRESPNDTAEVKHAAAPAIAEAPVFTAVGRLGNNPVYSGGV